MSMHNIQITKSTKLFKWLEKTRDKPKCSRRDKCLLQKIAPVTFHYFHRSPRNATSLEREAGPTELIGRLPDVIRLLPPIWVEMSLTPLFLLPMGQLSNSPFALWIVQFCSVAEVDVAHWRLRGERSWRKRCLFPNADVIVVLVAVAIRTLTNAKGLRVVVCLQIDRPKKRPVKWSECAAFEVRVYEIPTRLVQQRTTLETVNRWDPLLPRISLLIRWLLGVIFSRCETSSVSLHKNHRNYWWVLWFRWSCLANFLWGCKRHLEGHYAIFVTKVFY